MGGQASYMVLEQPEQALQAGCAFVNCMPVFIASDAEVDVRGQAADDAVDHVVAALDRAALAGERFLRIIHGHGTGRLKASLREYLKDSPYVEEFRPGDRSEGGDGVTVAKLR